MARQLFGDLVVSDVRGRRRRSRASLPLSVALHGAGALLLLAVPLFTPLELPEDPPAGPLVFRLPRPIPIVHAAPRPQAAAARAGGVSRPVAAALRPATQAAPSKEPDGLPVPDDRALASLDDALPLGPGCSRPGCLPGLSAALGGGEPGHGERSAAVAGPERVLVSGRDVSPPLKLYDVPPVYPELARRIRVAGEVVIACTIAPDGRVADARVVSGPPLLDAAALAAVLRWRYRPTLLGGTPVAVALTVTVRFRLGA